MKGSGPLARARGEGVHSTSEVVEAQVGVVPDGLGSPMGLSVAEHLAWSSVLPHPSQLEGWPAVPFLSNAVEFEASRSADCVDSFRDKLVRDWVRKAFQLHGKHAWMFDSCGLGDSLIRHRLHVPLAEYFLEQLVLAGMPYEDPDVVKDMLLGFVAVGRLPPCVVEAVGSDKLFAGMSVHELLESRGQSNADIVCSLRESDFVHDLSKSMRTTVIWVLWVRLWWFRTRCWLKFMSHAESQFVKSARLVGVRGLWMTSRRIVLMLRLSRATNRSRTVLLSWFGPS